MWNCCSPPLHQIRDLWSMKNCDEWRAFSINHCIWRIWGPHETYVDMFCMFNDLGVRDDTMHIDNQLYEYFTKNNEHTKHQNHWENNTTTEAKGQSWVCPFSDFPATIFCNSSKSFWFAWRQSIPVRFLMNTKHNRGRSTTLPLWKLTF